MLLYLLIYSLILLVFTAAQLGRLCLNAYVLKWGASCQPGGVYKAWGILPFLSCPAHCLTWTIRYFLLLHHPFIHLSLPLPSLKTQQRAPPLFLHFCQRMSVLSSFISALPLSTIISPPWFSSSRRVHPPSLPLREPTAINQLLVSSRGRLVSAASSISPFTVSCIHFLSTCDIVFARSCFAFVLPADLPCSLFVFISPLRPSVNSLSSVLQISD